MPPVEEYVDASVGTYKTGDKVSIPEYNIKGTIGYGVMEDGKILSETFIVDDTDGNNIMGYTQIGHPTLGHLEMISYPQRGEKGEVYIEINGVDSGCVFVYSKYLKFESYLSIFNDLDSPDIQKYIIQSC